MEEPGPMNETARRGPVSFQDRSTTQILAVILALGPVYVFALYSHLTRDRAYNLAQMLTYPLLFGGLTIVLILLLLRHMCGEGVAALNPKDGSFPKDIGLGILLAALMLAVHFVLQSTVYRWLPGAPQNMDSVSVLFRGLSENPLVLALFLGPVIWIGVAGFEELTRVFFLTRTWKVWESDAERWALVVVSAALFGLVHIYQGPSGAVGNAIIGLVMGAFFLLAGRIVPLIVAHAIFDSAQIIMVVSMVRRGVIRI
jgi:membrane protease YdiL (CAAX protease family)